MPRPPSQRDRERARQQSRDAANQRRSAAQRRQRRTLALVGFVLVLALFAGVAGALVGNKNTSSTATTTSTGSSTTTVVQAGTAKMPVVPTGAALTGPTPCPAFDGSSPRTTSFAGPPPTCIDPGRFYSALVHTSKGDLQLQLNPQQAANAVNNFVVLSLYHYYDGQPFTAVVSHEAAVVGARFDPAGGQANPGYTVASETPAAGQIFVPGTVSFIPIDPSSKTDTAYGASFLIATFDQAAALPQTLTSFGIMLDGQDALVAIDKVGSQQGTPTEVVTINSIDITPSVPIG